MNVLAWWICLLAWCAVTAIELHNAIHAPAAADLSRSLLVVWLALGITTTIYGRLTRSNENVWVAASAAIYFLGSYAPRALRAIGLFDNYQIGPKSAEIHHGFVIHDVLVPAAFAFVLVLAITALRSKTSSE